MIKCISTSTILLYKVGLSYSLLLIIGTSSSNVLYEFEYIWWDQVPWPVIGGPTSMTAEDLLVHDCGHREAVEAVCEGLPQLDVVAPLACRSTTLHPLGST